MISIQEAARRHGVSTKTVRRAIRRVVARVLKRGDVYPVDLVAAALAAHREHCAAVYRRAGDRLVREHTKLAIVRLDGRELPRCTACGILIFHDDATGRLWMAGAEHDYDPGVQRAVGDRCPHCVRRYD